MHIVSISQCYCIVFVTKILIWVFLLCHNNQYLKHCSIMHTTMCVCISNATTQNATKILK